MTKKQFNRDYMVRVRFLGEKGIRYMLKLGFNRANILVGYDDYCRILDFKAAYVLKYVQSRYDCKVVVRPFHGVEVTFIAH